MAWRKSGARIAAAFARGSVPVTRIALSGRGGSASFAPAGAFALVVFFFAIYPHLQINSSPAFNRTRTTAPPKGEVRVVRIGFTAGRLPHLPHLPHRTFQGAD